MNNETKETNKEFTLEEAVTSLKTNLNTPLTPEQINKINSILENDSEADQVTETPRKIASPKTPEIDA